MNDEVVLAQVQLGFPWQTMDPFLFCVHHDDAYPVANEQMGPAASLAGRNIGSDFEGKDGWRMYHGHVVPGFPQHPHRGFETVTVVRRGLIDHSDSLGATARFGRGDTQWLTAGKGIVHCEMFPLLDQERPNPVELFQIWLNLPRANKMVEPHFSMIWADNIPLVSAPGAQISLIAGQLGETLPPKSPPKSWASQPGSDVAIWTGKLDPHATWVLPKTQPGTNRMLYFFAGTQLDIAGVTIHRGTGVRLRPDVDVQLKNTEGDAEFLILQGKPIGEPVVSYGPFVMNSQQEIIATFADYQRTEFGGWPWETNDPVHPREEGRFAKHADGRIERPQ